MSLLLETTLGDIVIDLDLDGSPELCKNVLKLAKARYYTSNLVYNVQPRRFCQWGDPKGDGSGGACIYGLLHEEGNDVTKSKLRFLKSSMGRILTPSECQEKGRVVATEMNGIADTIGSQLLITIDEGQEKALDGFQSLGFAGKSMSGGSDSNELMAPQSFRSVGKVVEDDNHVLDQIAAAYCDANGRPYADIRINRALVIDDPFDDPPGMKQLMKRRGIVFDGGNDIRSEEITKSPEYERPPEETVEIRIQADQIDPEAGEEDIEKLRQQEEQLLQREDKSRAVVLEMLGDLPSADIKAPENVLFVCKLNPVTEDEDLELIFSRFDEKVKAEIIRDHETGSSLQYAFVEFSTKEQAAEAYFKMNNALVDDRRIKVDFSQSVAKVWDRFNQRQKGGPGQNKNRPMPHDPFGGGVRGNHGRGQDEMIHGKGRGGHRRNGPRHRERSHGDEEEYNRHGNNRRSDPTHHRDRHENQQSKNEFRQHDRHIEARSRHRYRHHHHEEHHTDGNHRDHSTNDHDGTGDHCTNRREEYRRSRDRKRHEDVPGVHGDRDEFGRVIRTKRSPSPRDRNRNDNGKEDASYSSDDKRRRNENRSRRSRSRDKKEKKHKKHKRKRDRRGDSRERKHKKHRRGRDEERKRRSIRSDDDSSTSSRS
ncbi:peptidyl-prolyl cis-trans isomerase [Nitzschia inconspicua]|uniref:Peptidyl-prolyl cis-trans isomerase n=1 Tax=Nitzschia inconspicua TaxID=303405 RepID=A0A9K3LGK2_9STRA|nr:peptidyl-prolyl cis-trans isomerase [Nitzschia inconspicua]